MRGIPLQGGGGRNLGVNPNLFSRWKREWGGGGSKVSPEQLGTLRAELKDPLKRKQTPKNGT